jgi:Squalene-hopene cyclase C-terminal domain
LIESALRWLLEPKDAWIRYQTLVDVLGYSFDSKEAVEARRRIPQHPIFKRVMARQSKDGFWPRKDTCDGPRFTGALWALMLLGEMAVVPDHRLKNEVERFFNLHQGESGSFSYRSKLHGKKHYDEPCLTGNMVRTLLVLGYGEDPRVQRAIQWMPEAQLADGGWNCDYPQFQNVKVRHSSFMSTIEPLWAYSEIPRQTWTRRMKRSMERGAEFLLTHRLYKADHHEWMPMNRTFTTIHFPMYFYYDVLHGLRVLTKLGYGDDERVRDAVHLVMSKRRPDGKWVLEGDWFSEPGTSTRWLKARTSENSSGPTDPWGNSLKGHKKFDMEPVGTPSKWVTLNCYRALTQTGDLRISNN